MDTNGDGQVTKDELKNLLFHLGFSFSESHINKMFKRADIGKDGKVDFNEFVTFHRIPMICKHL